jgi:serine/threonine-protein kinase HipA
LAKEVGITVPEFRLISINEIEGLPQVEHFKSRQALAVKRFDRADDGSHIHIEDFAQVYGVYPEDKYSKVSYANMANMIYTLGGERELEEYIKRLRSVQV